MNKTLYFVPFGYFVKTRLNTKQAVLFHGYAEYLLGILLLIYGGMPASKAIEQFLIAYLAFISLYEIGYIINDFVSVKYENNPRKRLGKYDPGNLVIFVWIVIRIACFLQATFFLTMQTSTKWWLFYLLLAIVFTLHNVLKRKENKIFTFFSLAFSRFYGPLFVALPHLLLLISIPCILMHYVFFRTLTYIDSKGLLNIPNRNSLSFKSSFYLCMLPLSLIISCLSGSLLCIYINLYFLIFWLSLQLLNANGVINIKDIQTS